VPAGGQCRRSRRIYDYGTVEPGWIKYIYKQIYRRWSDAAGGRLPADVRAVLERAIKQAVEDPEFHAVVKKMKKTPSYASSQEVEKMVQDAAYQPYLGIVKQLVQDDKKK